jgi:hypothetical protein
MPPNTQRTVRLYQDAMEFAPPPGFPSRWPPGTGPRRSPTSTRRFHGPIPRRVVRSPAMKFAARRSGAQGLGDGDGIGGWGDDLLNIGKGAVASVTQPVSDKLTNLEIAIKTILVLSAVAAGTGVIGMIRR